MLGSDISELRSEPARARFRAVLQRTQYRDVQGRQPSGQHEQAVALADAELLQDVCEAVAQGRQFAIAQFERVCVTRDKAQGAVRAPTALGMTIHRLEADVQSATGQALQGTSCLAPDVLLSSAFIVGPVRSEAVL